MTPFDRELLIWEELAADQALHGATAEERAQLAQLGAAPELLAELEILAAELTALADPEPLPAALRERLLAHAAHWSSAPAAPQLAGPRSGPRSLPATHLSRSFRVAAWLAAAAVVALAFLGWDRWLVARRSAAELRLASVAAPGGSALSAAAAELAQDPEVQRRSVAGRSGARTLVWKQTSDPAASQASGDVVWDPQSGEGYMRFEKLAANDPEVSQYQLWIFDAERDERYPVDGGVFDVTGESSIVRIRAKVPVHRATLFAVTIEKPGGVVVSARERIVVTASVPPT